MSDKTFSIGDIQLQLIEEKKSLESIAESVHAQDPVSDPTRLQDNAASDTEANEESTHDRMQAVEKTVIGKIDAINTALERIEAGTYEQCIICGKAISRDRLRIAPTATSCISCERKKTS